VKVVVMVDIEAALVATEATEATEATVVTVVSEGDLVVKVDIGADKKEEENGKKKN